MSHYDTPSFFVSPQGKSNAAEQNIPDNRYRIIAGTQTKPIVMETGLASNAADRTHPGGDALRGPSA